MPVMPIEEYAPFTPEEKAQIIARHKELVDKFNERLPFGKKLRVDENLSKKLDNPETIALYRIGQKAHELHQKQAAIHKQMENKFGKVTESNCMSRSLVYAFDTSGTEEAKKYNESMIIDWCIFSF